MTGEAQVADLDPFALLDAESERVARSLGSLDEDGWTRDTRAAGWSVRDMLGHLAGVETYHLACLDDSLGALFEEAKKSGVAGLDAFNDWAVRMRADRPRDEVLSEWRRKNLDVRSEMRARGRDGSMASSVGPYPVGLMAFHVASEYATHADDMHIEIPDRERAARTTWRLKVSRFAIEEAKKPVEIEERGNEVTVRSVGKEATLSAHDFVEAVTGRLPDGHAIDADLRDALRALA